MVKLSNFGPNIIMAGYQSKLEPVWIMGLNFAFKQLSIMDRNSVDCNKILECESQSVLLPYGITDSQIR